MKAYKRKEKKESLLWEFLIRGTKRKKDNSMRYPQRVTNARRKSQGAAPEKGTQHSQRGKNQGPTGEGSAKSEQKRERGKNQFGANKKENIVNKFFFNVTWPHLAGGLTIVIVAVFLLRL